jgi:hypothetical protein
MIEAKKLYKENIRDNAINYAIGQLTSKELLSHDFTTLKVEYKWVLQGLIYEMQKEIDKLNNDLGL